MRVGWDPHCPIHGPQPGKFVEIQLQYRNGTTVPKESGGVCLLGPTGLDDLEWSVTEGSGSTVFFPTITHLRMGGEMEIQLRYAAVIDMQQVGTSQSFYASQPRRLSMSCARVLTDTLSVTSTILLPGEAEPANSRCTQVRLCKVCWHDRGFF